LASRAQNASAHRALFGGKDSPPPRYQRGWIGLIGLLLALVIVAVLAQRVLKTYGFLAGAEPAAKSADERGPRGPGGISAAPLDSTAMPATPSAALERARGVENTVQQQANDLSKRIDETSK
jgi:hypothetical protein